jgi:hypothetical protein
VRRLDVAHSDAATILESVVVRKYYIRPGGAVARHEFNSEWVRVGDDTGSMQRRRPSVSSTVRRLFRDLGTFVWLGLTSRARLAAENLFLRKQLALYQERHTKPRRPDPATRVALVLLARLLDWRSILTVIQPRHADPLASPGLAAHLAMADPAGLATHSGGSATTDRHHGPGKPDLGRGTSRE